jgi:hypothetical protein
VAEPAVHISRSSAPGVFGFGRAGLDVAALGIPGATPRRGTAGVKSAAAAGALRALVLDARGPSELARALELLRALYDDPQEAGRALSPERVLAVIATGDVEGAFSLGRFGIAAVVQESEIAELALLASRVSERSEAPLVSTPALGSPRSTRLGPGTSAPTVVIGHRHAPETLALLARYLRVLRAHALETSVFEDVATLIERMLEDDLTCQTSLAAKAGATHAGQFIGSFEFYRELRRTRYARIPEHPRREVAMDVFIAVDEILHEVLHLLFLANRLRAGIAATATHFAEELSLTWWQAVIHARVFPEWLAADRTILEINDDFLLSAENAQTRGFWTVGTVFDRYAVYPWVPYVIAHLPQRASYIGERPDLAAWIGSLASRPEAAFLADGPGERLTVPVPFVAYPVAPSGLALR